MRFPTDTTTSWRSSPRYVYGPSRDGDEGLHDHHGSSCAHGIRECVYGSCCAADTCASRHNSGGRRSGSIKRSSGGVKPKSVETIYGVVTGAIFEGNGSSKPVDFVLQSEKRICCLGQRFSCGQLWMGGQERAPEEPVDNFWIGCLLSVKPASSTP